MTSMVDVIRAVVRRELASVRQPALGVVTAVHPHADAGDDFNDEADVTLQHEGVELPRVPVAVARPGAGALVKVGDLVLVQFLGADLQQPLVTASFHTADDRPPVHADGEHVVEQRIDGKPRNRVRCKADGQLLVERLDESGTVTVSLLLDGAGNLQLTATGKTVTIKCQSLTVEGDLTVSGGKFTASRGGASTTIDGHSITGS